MGRPARVDVAGLAYHVLNRSVGRRRLFRRESDFAAFERVLAEAVARADGAVELLAYSIMGNHWHLVVRTTVDGALSRFMKWLTLTHTQRYRAAHGNVGDGPVYQGRFKSFVIQTGQHFLTVCRYVERNAARAALVERAEDWQWSSLWCWRNGGIPRSVEMHKDDEAMPLAISPWPLSRDTVAASDGTNRPKHWLRTVNAPLSESELAALRKAAQRCRPYGTQSWVNRMIQSFNLASTIRPPGRPKGDPE